MFNTTLSTNGKKALVIGSSGQDGSYLTELLISQGVTVIPVNRRFFNGFECELDLRHMGVPSLHQISLILNLSFFSRIYELVQSEKPDFIYHLAAHHSPSRIKLISDRDESLMWLTHVGITGAVLESIRRNSLDSKLIVAGSSLMFSAEEEDVFVDEFTIESPRNYYGETKLLARKLMHSYAVEHGSRAQMAILFNHESPRRPQGYLSSDIALQIVNVIKDRSKLIEVRDPNVRVDLSDARDIVLALAEMADSSSGDFVLGSGKVTLIKDLIQSSLQRLGLDDIEIRGTGSYDSHLPKNDHRSGVFANSEKANKVLGWFPNRDISETIVEIVESKA
jgi:GDPmannose 4,6-dehydratase